MSIKSVSPVAFSAQAPAAAPAAAPAMPTVTIVPGEKGPNVKITDGKKELQIPCKDQAEAEQVKVAAEEAMAKAIQQKPAFKGEEPQAPQAPLPPEAGKKFVANA